MNTGIQHNVDSSHKYPDNFKAGSSVITGPISAVQKGIETGVDTFVEKIEKKKKKKSTKAAIAAGSTVLVLSGLVMMFNPRYSNKIMQKFKIWEEQARLRMKKNKDSYLKGKFHKFCTSIFEGSQKAFTLVSNANSLKDVGVQYACCEKNKNITLKNNKTLESILKKVDKGFTAIFEKPHKKITEWFDTIGKKTVEIKYKNATSSLDSFELFLEQYTKDLPADKKRKLASKLAEIKKGKTFLNKDNLATRLKEQGDLMVNLERDWKRKWRSYTKGYSWNSENNSQNFVKNLTFWAEDILQPQKEKVGKEGAAAVEKLIGNGKNTKGLYDDILDIIKDDISKENYATLEKTLKSASKKLRKANHSECVEYFDKKRDLVLGGAPTDILTAIFGLGATGIAVGRANDKEEKVSRLVTIGIPAVIGLGTNIVCTAALLSGPVGILTGLAASFITNRIAVAFDKHVLGHDDEDVEEPAKTKKNTKEKQVEVQNA